MRKVLLSLLAGFIPVLIVTEFLKSKEFYHHTKLSADSTVTISITAVGDLMCHSPEYESARVAADSYNFNPVFEFVKPYIQNSDFAFGNFEAVTAGKEKGYSGYPMFNVPDDFVSGIKSAGFQLLTTSNNHAFDRGEAGVRRTISVINDAGIFYTGTFTSQRDRDSIRIFNIKGIKLAVLAYTYGTNGNSVPKSRPYLINIIDSSQIKNDINASRAAGAEIVLVYYHFGTEYMRYPTEYQKNIVAFTISAGADIIIGGHPHVIEPAEYFKTEGAKLDTGFVVYSMGNFLSNQRWRFSDAGVILKILLKKNFNTGKISISEASYLPTWVYKGYIEGKNAYRILPAADSLNPVYEKNMSPSDKVKMRQAFNDTKEILTKYTDKISVWNVNNK